MMRRGHLTGDHTDTDGSGYEARQPSVLTKVKPGKLEGTVALAEEPRVPDKLPASQAEYPNSQVNSHNLTYSPDCE